MKGGSNSNDGESTRTSSTNKENSGDEKKTVTLTTTSSFKQLTKSPILNYDQAHIDRLDKRWRFDEVRRLRQSQNCLKEELTKAKERIGADPKRWSFELHVEENLSNNSSPAQNGIQDTDPTFVEALDKETSILGKRVDACKSHAVLQTCFAHSISCEKLLHKF